MSEESADFSLYISPEIKNLKVTSWNFFNPRNPFLGNAATRSISSGAVFLNACSFLILDVFL